MTAAAPEGLLRRAWRAPGPAGRVALLAVVLLGLVVGAAQLVELRASSNAGCTNSCHADTKEHAHGELACVSCHDAPGAMVSARLVWGEVFGSKTPPKHAALRSEPCESCHARALAASVTRLEPAQAKSAVAYGETGRRAAALWASASVAEGHRAHGPRTPGETDCLSCHRGSEHGGTPAGASCKGCHDEASVHVTPLAKDEPDCTSCHGFAARRVPAADGSGGTERANVVAVCARCHGTPAPGSLPPPAGDAPVVVAEGILHGEVACGDCHSPHPGSGTDAGHACARCHEVKMPDPSSVVAARFKEGTKPPSDVAGHRNCEGCHAAHAPQKLAIAACKNCHPDQSEARGESSTALRHDNCASCHQPHTWAAERAGCVKCHSEVAAKVMKLGPEKHTDCSSCHEPHAPLPGAQVCASCHEDKKFHVSSAPAGHRECKGCHDPHADKSGASSSCGRCHSNVQHEVGTAVPRHGQLGCVGCHQPHGSPIPPPTRCQSCHQKQSSLAMTAGTPARHQNCGSCHQPHTFKITAPSQACARCHSTLTSAGSHSGNCLDCHKQHGPPKPEPNSCGRCHTNVDGAALAAQGHKACNGCHQPHKRAGAARTICRNCHTTAHAAAASWPAGSPHAEAGKAGSGACPSCHQPHRFNQETACQSCHINQASTFGGNKHRCESCHVVAEARPAPTATANGQKGWWTSCNKCHTGQVAGAAARRSEKHRRCENCHTQHQAGKPTCQSCHQAIASSGAHQQQGHKQCTKCHETHAPSNIERKQCLSCHDDMSDHQPNSPRCQACHLFR
ncbi:MAG: hypothetical protein IT373_11845 [Polyangiaceae bacterium]|nr:hypothetical protein [Polyangiaceae bacterium]